MTKNNWRRDRTLKRRVEFRPIEPDDMKYVWAAYKMGALTSMGPQFEDGEMDGAEFRKVFEAEFFDSVRQAEDGTYVLEPGNYDAAWTLLAESPKGFRPVGLVVGFWAHPRAEMSPFMTIGDIVWFGWASARNKVEAGVKFFDEMRKEMNLVEYANEEARPYFEMLAKHAVMRRVGTSYSIYPDQATAIFETRKP